MALRGCLLLGLALCSSHVYADDTILFVGNSLTYTHDLPNVCAPPPFPSPRMRLNPTRFPGLSTVQVSSSTYGGATLKLHATDPSNYTAQTPIRTIETIRSQHWDLVVLQEQSSGWDVLCDPEAHGYGRPIFDNTGHFTGTYRLYPSILVDEAHQAGAKVMFFSAFEHNYESDDYWLSRNKAAEACYTWTAAY
ncbi:uncharacterized protein MONBRDRAFT_31047, partial [Monosiga brevicollis MX1]